MISVLASVISAGTNNQLGSAISTVLSLGWVIYNQGYLGGTTGQSWGRKIVNLRLVSEATGQPIGIGMALLRQLAHIVDSIICYVGWFFPLWDAKRQTIADKIMKTLVLDESQSGTGQQPFGF